MEARCVFTDVCSSALQGERLFARAEQSPSMRACKRFLAASVKGPYEGWGASAAAAAAFLCPRVKRKPSGLVC
eukprot:15478332-Alexandrium_andersonii.AAC.1